MLIVCPNCATSYMIDPATLGVAGRAVRCARCKATWFVNGKDSTESVHADAGRVTADAETSSESAFPPVPMEPVDNPPAIEQEPSSIEGETTTPVEEDSETVPAPEPEVPGRDDRADGPAEVSEGVEDAALPVPIADAPSLVPVVQPLPEAAPTELETEEAESFAARRERLHKRRTRSFRSSRWTALILLLFAFNVAVVGARNEVVRYLPQTASLFAAIGLPVNLRHLRFENVRIVKDSNGTLTVEGAIVSTASEPIDVPRLRFAARNAAGQEVYTWTAAPSRSSLEPGGKLDFRSELASPPLDAANVMVRFLTREDASAGEK
jgi:predicted Zn finger-like uncharacterized protein